MIKQKTIPIPTNEINRIDDLYEYDILDTLPEAEFDSITKLAASICKTPIALITFIDTDRQWIKSKVGVDIDETSREISFCQYALLNKHIFEIKNATKDPRFCKNPLVVNPPNLRFYAGMPLTSPNGHNLGTLCVLDKVPRKLTSHQKNSLKILAKAVVTHLELRKKNNILEGRLNDIADKETRKNRQTLLEQEMEMFLLKSAINKSNIVIEYDANGLILNANQNFLKLFGYKISEIAGRDHSILVDKDELKSEAYRHFRSTLAKGNTFQGQVKRMKKNGTEVWLQECYNPLINDQSELLGQVCLAQDISKSKLLEEERKMFFRLSVDLICTAGTDGFFKRLNPSFEKTLGYSKNELLTKSFLEFVHPEDVQSTLNEIEKLSQGLLTISFTNRYRCKDGTYRWLEWNSAPAGESIFAIARDITERIENENKLKESLSETSQYKYALDQSAIVSITTIDGIVTYVNDNFCKISQFKKEEILNRNLREINPGYFAQNEFDEMYPVITAGKIWHGELKNKAKDGSFYWVDTIIVPFMDDNDKPFQFLGIRHDITERKKAEFELLELKQNLENKVIERTHQLESSNQDLEKEKIKSDELLLNILPQTVASELKSSGVFSPSYMNSVTVVFTDFLNFTQISENLSPHEVVSLINHYYVAFDNLTSKYGLEKIKTIGDSYMCAGGLPVENNSHAEDAVRFAIEICQFVTNEKIKLEALGKPYFEMRIGLNSGPVVAGIVGVKKYAYDIWGDTVNIAARMETSGEAGKVNISGSTYALVKDNFHCIYRGKIEAKNKGVIDMYYVNL